jgi:hypothetical protein
MKILVLGANGRTGRLVMNRAVILGDALILRTCFVPCTFRMPW